MKKKLLALMIASMVTGVAMANPVDPNANIKHEDVDPFSGDELRLERLNKELQLQKAIVANLREQLNQTNVKADIATSKLKGEYDQKKIKKDTDRLDGAPMVAVTPSVVTPQQLTPPPLTPSVKVEPPVVKSAPKKETPKPDVLLGAIQFGNEKPSYLVEKADGRFATATEIDPKAVPVKQTGFYTTVKESDIVAGLGKLPRPSQGFNQVPTNMPSSIPITVPELAPQMRPAPFNNNM